MDGDVEPMETEHQNNENVNEQSTESTETSEVSKDPSDVNKPFDHVDPIVNPSVEDNKVAEDVDNKASEATEPAKVVMLNDDEDTETSQSELTKPPKENDDIAIMNDDSEDAKETKADDDAEASSGLRISSFASMTSESKSLEATSDLQIGEVISEADDSQSKIVNSKESPELTKENTNDDIAMLNDDTEDAKEADVVNNATETPVQDPIEKNGKDNVENEEASSEEAIKSTADHEMEDSNNENPLIPTASSNHALDDITEVSNENEETSLKTAKASEEENKTSKEPAEEKDNDDDEIVMLDDDEDSESLPKIANVTSAEESQKSTSDSESQSNGSLNDQGSGSGLKISSFAMMSEPEKSPEPSKDAKENENEDAEASSGLQISSIASMTSEPKSPEATSELQIGEVTSQADDSQSKIVNSEESPIKIANVVSSQDSEKPNSDLEKSRIKFAKTISEKSGNDNEANIVNLDDDEEEDDFDKMTKEKPKAKPVLKLASFANSSTNGITEEEPKTPTPPPRVGQCQMCDTDILSYKSGVAWETMLFKDDNCLAKYQERMNQCSTCKTPVQPVFVGKYCVRFGSSIKQFCTNKCLEEHKKGLKVCCYCQKDISGGDGFLAPIGNKGQFKDFCKQICLAKFEARQNKTPLEKELGECAVCKESKLVEKTLQTKDSLVKLCSGPCASAYKFGLEGPTKECDLCNNFFTADLPEAKEIFYGGTSKRFCSEACQNVFVMQTREIVPCSWCKVRKYNFDMIEKFEKDVAKHFCSINCLKLVGSSGKPVVVKSVNSTSTTMTSTSTAMDSSIPVIQSVSSLAASGATQPPAQADKLPTQPVPAQQLMPTPAPQIINRINSETIVKLPAPLKVTNKAINCRPFMLTKGVSCRPHPCHKGTQTDIPSTPALLPITVPMYLPVPMQMYQRPYPVPIPIPVPIPVPIFIPTTRNSIKGIEKQLKKIKAKLPSDPLEAELLALAGAIGGDDETNDFDSDDSVPEGDGVSDEDKPLKRPKKEFKYNEDIENIMSGNKIVPKALPQVTPDMASTPNQHHHGHHQHQHHSANSRSNHGTRSAVKRRFSSKDESDEEYSTNNSRNRRSRGGVAKQARTSSQISQEQNNIAAFPQPPKERPDATNHLKFTYGVNAWRHWVVGKNAELEKARAQGKYIKPFETDILKLRADELNYTLCMFVKEVRKPNGDNYAADSILYLTLGIQEYLFTSGRIDNLFTDVYYEAFTGALHEVIKDFKLPTNQMGYFVTRIEEEHLWEARQLGAHSPQVLLNTLIYFNVKYFMLKTTDEHKKLSFTHIMKHVKKGGTAVPCSRNTTPGDSKQTLLLRYYPPADRGRQNNQSDHRKCYEQHEIPDPTRCPVKLYEFYLSKCPDNVRARSDLFYLQPERSCVPDSPVWYSTHELNEHAIDKMLQRILMVREVQEHMLADGSQHG